ncbi:T-cell immunoglobulin and mucin domain-containing protein 4 [Stegastes partitus]|uniref:T-cell immunoglobulin and mucin domain-containing protein 4 n=1 Tax=Stegastes partitus TaxID=144197 RepID=UPI000494E09D|nr:PREDICTED: hepatitis A virus cellular receptor 1 homolog [Stegastes partitus]
MNVYLPQFVCLCAAGGHFSSVSSFKVAEGGVASLSCQYSVKRFGLSRVCWGRGCGTFWCSNILVQTDENGVISKVADRYRLTGDVLDGQMDLDILNVRRTDSGPYCCRVDIDGIFNDKKVIMNLRVVKGESHDSCSLRGPVLRLAVDILERTMNSRCVKNCPSVLPKHDKHLALSTTADLQCDKFLSSSSFSSEEPPHIIYEIRMRRPVQENIYTLD